MFSDRDIFVENVNSHIYNLFSLCVYVNIFLWLRHVDLIKLTFYVASRLQLYCLLFSNMFNFN